jgi:hypothetical protein
MKPATVAEVVRDYFGYPGNDYAIPSDEAVAIRHCFGGLDGQR